MRRASRNFTVAAFVLAAALGLVSQRAVADAVVGTKSLIASGWAGSSAAFDGTNFLVALESDTTTAKVAAQLVSASGAKVGSVIALGHDGQSCCNSGAAFDGTNYLVTWEEDQGIKNASYPFLVYGQFISKSGAKVGAAFAMTTQGIWFDGTGMLAYGGGKYLLTYTRLVDAQLGDQSPTNRYVAGRIVSTDGSMGSEFRISQGYGNGSSVGFDGTNFFVVWKEDSQDYEVRGRFVSPAGALGQEISVNASQAASDNPVLVDFDGTNYLVGWTDSTDTESTVSVQLVSTSGALVGGVITGEGQGGRKKVLMGLGFDGNNHLAVGTQMSNDANKNNVCDAGESTCWDVSGQYMTKDGALVGGAFAINMDAGNQSGGLVCAGGKCLALINNNIVYGSGGPTQVGEVYVASVTLSLQTDIRSYIPAANGSAGYSGFLRVINTGSAATPVSVAVIDGTTGAVGASGQLNASLPAGAAVTYTAQEVEAALGQALPAGDRPRVRVTANSTIEVQSFMLNPGGAVTQIADAMTAETGYAVRSYVPAAVAGYTSFIRVINVGSAATPVQATLIDDTTGADGATGVLIASLPAGAAVTLNAGQIESALGVSPAAASRPRVRVSSTATPSMPLEVQSFIGNPGGAVTQVGGAASGTSATVRNFVTAAMDQQGYSSFIRVINTGASATPITLDLIDGDTGTTTVSGKQLVASLPAGAATTFTAQQIESALGVSLPAGARPRVRVVANVTIEVQSFMGNPGGMITQISGAQSGASTVDVRTYIPAASAAGGYSSFIRVINIGTAATPVSVAVVDGATGAAGTAGQLNASLPVGAAVTYTAQQVEAALGMSLPAGDRPRLRVTANSAIEVQSFMSNPDGAVTETVDAQ